MANMNTIAKVEEPFCTDNKDLSFMGLMEVYAVNNLFGNDRSEPPYDPTNVTIGVDATCKLRYLNQVGLPLRERYFENIEKSYCRNPVTDFRSLVPRKRRLSCCLDDIGSHTYDRLIDDKRICKQLFR
jgi:hypothetical protein